jgi:hypothetical protein
VQTVQLSANKQELTPVIVTAADTLVWQALASVAVPGFTINRLCALTGVLVARTYVYGTRAHRHTRVVRYGHLSAIGCRRLLAWLRYRS